MFERPHHQRIEKLLRALDGGRLERAECFFGGGTAIALLLGEYRESVDVDFLCASTDGYRELRAAVFDGSLAQLTMSPLKQLRELRTDQYGIRTFVEVDGVPIKFEIVREARITLTGAMHPTLGVPVLSRQSLFAEKLLANADRGADRATFNRDAIDLGMMAASWGPVPAESWALARLAYGATIDAALADSVRRLRDPAWRRSCLSAMHMTEADGDRLLGALQAIVAPA